MGNLKSRRPGRMIWPCSYTTGNARRVELLRKPTGDLSANEAMELAALEAMVEAWVESRYPAPRIEPPPVYRELPAIRGERFIRPEFSLDEEP